jgi:hypothetical protein
MAMGNTPFVKPAEDLMLEGASEEQRHKIAEAKAFILKALAGGPQLASQVLQAAADCGIAEGTLYYAKRALGVSSTRQGYQSPWIWRLPGADLRKQFRPLQRHNREVVVPKA